MWAARRVTRAPATRAGSLEADVARIRGSRSAPRRARRLPSRIARCSSALLSDLLRLDLGGGGRPGSPGTRAAGGRALGPRECAPAARGRARRGGLEPGVCCLGSWRRALVPAALPRGGGHKAIRRPRPHAALRRPRAGRDPAKLPSPPSPFPRPQAPAPLGPRRPRPCNGSAGYARGALPAQALGARPAIQRAGPAACWVCGVRAGQVPRQRRAYRHSAARLGHGRPRQARASGRTRAASRGAIAPLARPAGPAPPPGAGPGTRARPLGTPPGWGPGGRRGAAVAVAEGGALPRTAGRGRPRPPAGPARPFRLLRARPRPPHPGQPPAAPPSRRALCCPPGPVTCLSARLAPVPLRTVHRRERACLCTCVPRTLPACVCRHAQCHICARRGAGLLGVRAPDGSVPLSRVSPWGRSCVPHCVQELDPGSQALSEPQEDPEPGGFVPANPHSPCPLQPSHLRPPRLQLRHRAGL